MTKLTEYVKTAELLGVAKSAIRKWGRGDIPLHRNPANGYRLFSDPTLTSF